MYWRLKPWYFPVGFAIDPTKKKRKKKKLKPWYDPAGEGEGGFVARTERTNYNWNRNPQPIPETIGDLALLYHAAVGRNSFRLRSRVAPRFRNISLTAPGTPGTRLTVRIAARIRGDAETPCPAAAFGLIVRNRHRRVIIYYPPAHSNHGRNKIARVPSDV